MLSSKAPLLFCQNPFCPRFNKKPFSNQAAYTQHIDRTIWCYKFTVKKSHLAAPHSASVSHHCHEDGNVTWTSNKRPALLRRHMVNDSHMDFVGTDKLLQSPAGNGVEVESTSCEDIEDCNKSNDFWVLSDDPNILTCTNSALDEDVEAPSFRSNFMYTTDQKWTVSLLKILDHANAPDYTFGEVLEWARSASADNYTYNPVGGLSCAKNVDALINSVCNGKKLLPFLQRVDVDHGSPSDVICFDFASQLLSLLQNPSIMTAENLVIDINDPLKPYHKLKGSYVLGEALSGSVYRKAYH
ncbi:hypothetical protein MHU86_17500 [Fragilaria crotonensis]|nr:hypothetical protein MHU86_17500 [Fragilaria crotonensis]